MRRREFVELLGGTLVALPLAARAALASEASGQRGDSKVPRIGVLLPGTATSFGLRTKAFLDGLRELGYVEGQTIAIEWRWGAGQSRGACGTRRQPRGAQCRRPGHGRHGGRQGSQERNRHDTDRD